MLASYNWLVELTGVTASPREVADKLTGGGLEVEAFETRGEGLDSVVIAEVRSKTKVPDKDKLSHVVVFDGEGEVDVICGAANVPDPGRRVLFARVGSVLPNGMEIGERKLGGVLSRGMICSEVELEIGTGAEGIFVVPADIEAAPGTPIADALGLRDTIFELGLTPNRPDGLGHIGLARDVAVHFGQTFTPPAPPEPARRGDGELGVSIEVADADRCPRYGAGLVRGVTLGPSPFWLRYRLHCLGLRAIHNVVDATNYVLLEHGHPTHAFDQASVRKRAIVVRLATDGEKMTTLDEVERTLTADDLLICDGEGPVAVAGVMGGANSEIGDATSDVLVECAYFAPRSVRRTGRRLGLHTDASHRFERGVDPNGVPRVLARTTQLIADLAGGAVIGAGVDENAQPIAPPVIDFRLDRCDALLGFETAPAEAVRIFEGLGFSVEKTGERTFRVTVPTFRPDISREVDLTEEVLRFRGFPLVPTTIPHVRPSADGTPLEVRFDRLTRGIAAIAGLYEAVNYAFVSRPELAAARAPEASVILENPLSEDRSVMRTSLLPGLAAAAGRALRRQVQRVTLFEVGNTFTATDGDLPREDQSLAFILAGPREAWIGDGEAFDFYDGKGFIEAIVGPLCLSAPVFSIDDELSEKAPWFHPRRRAAVAVQIDGEHIALGSLGELHPEVAEALDLDTRAIYAELSVPALFRARQAVGDPQASALPRFPAVNRDIAMELDEEHSAGVVADAIRYAAGDLVEQVRLFDLYRGEQVAAGKKSLAFRVTYRDPAATLTDKKVDKAHARAAKAMKAQFAATVR
ncbi:MAG: phenylalanine--tRNA ligase subunit beta [Deltaproteobacteria bacterium]|nr:MAG: phenylalanine--tRNA ligase subunit beta [Deltaproteobacteria bacterium]